MSDRILTLNAGSSSLKFALFEVADRSNLALVSRGKIEGGDSQPVLVAVDSGGAKLADHRWPGDATVSHEEIFAELINWGETHEGGGKLVAVGHRVVHGGTEFAAPVEVSDDVLMRLDRLTPLAPLHQPHNLSPIRALMKARPSLPQVACFDTAFHRGRVPVTMRFALPREYEAAGVERYGFHGLSYEYVSSVLPMIAPDLASARVIVAHLGNGASLCALRSGTSIDTTMSFTALDGVPMGTRCGALDPGVVLYLIRERGMSAAAVEDLLYHRSGLLGVSGLSGDMRVLLASEEQGAVDAIELFTFRIAREIGALATSLGGLDGLVFTAGIGERAPEIRRQICIRAEWLGVSLDGAANARGHPRISAADSRVSVWVIPTDEEAMIARHTLAIVSGQLNAKERVMSPLPKGLHAATPRQPVAEFALSDEELRRIDAYWRAANYLSVGQIYLMDNPLLREPLQLAHVKPRLLGHWGTTPGLNFVYVHLNRLIKAHDLSVLYVTGPGHGGPGLVANTYLEGTYSEVYPNIAQNVDGMRRLFKQFSFPGGVPSHVAPETPGSINEGGELGYSLLHAYGAVFDNPDLLACCVVGDGEAETAALAASWHSNKFLNPARDGAVLPILHLNGYKIASPTILARLGDDELTSLFHGYGYAPVWVAGDEPEAMHRLMATALETAFTDIRAIQSDARTHGFSQRPLWPLIILKTPKGWTGPKTVDGRPVEGTFRSHQVPLAELASKPEHLKALEAWMKSYRSEELFDETGRLSPELAALAPEGTRRMGANPHANGGLLLKDLMMPAFQEYAVAVKEPGASEAEATRVAGRFLRDVMKLNSHAQNFRVMGPDETASNRLDALFEVTDRVFVADILPTDDHLSPDGRVMEVLSEHLCQGWLEGYLLTGRHGFFSCYEAFIHIIDSMFNQHAKWLKTTREIAWRRPIASLNYLLTSHVWRQDHNGFSHQDPGFLDHVINKKADVVRVYLPPDANTLLSVVDHCLRSRNYVNVIVAGKQPALQWLDMEAAIRHCTVGVGIWPWASSDAGGEPDVVMACAGDVPTLETLAAVDILRKHIPELRIRVVNVVDLMTLQSSTEHPHGLSDRDFDSIFTPDKPVIFAFHGYPWLIHRLTYRRTNHGNFHVRGYKEEGTTTTPFDVTVLNELDRFHLASDAVDRVPRLRNTAAHLKQHLRDKLIEHRLYIVEHGEDTPEIRDWRWTTQ